MLACPLLYSGGPRTTEVSSSGGSGVAACGCLTLMIGDLLSRSGGTGSENPRRSLGATGTTSLAGAPPPERGHASNEGGVQSIV